MKFETVLKLSSVYIAELYFQGYHIRPNEPKGNENMICTVVSLMSENKFYSPCEASLAKRLQNFCFRLFRVNVYLLFVGNI